MKSEEIICENCKKPYSEHTCYWSPCVGCEGGHPSFHKTIIESPQWKAWQKVGQYDFSECNELGIISSKHFQDFIKFIIKNYESLDNL